MLFYYVIFLYSLNFTEEGSYGLFKNYCMNDYALFLACSDIIKNLNYQQLYKFHKILFLIVWIEAFNSFHLYHLLCAIQTSNDKIL